MVPAIFDLKQYVWGVVESPPFSLPANRVEALFLAFSQSLGATDAFPDATSCGSEEEGGRFRNWPSSLKFFRKHGREAYCTCLESRHRFYLSKVRILLLPPDIATRKPCRLLHTSRRSLSATEPVVFIRKLL